MKKKDLDIAVLEVAYYGTPLEKASEKLRLSSSKIKSLLKREGLQKRWRENNKQFRIRQKEERMMMSDRAWYIQFEARWSEREKRGEVLKAFSPEKEPKVRYFPKHHLASRSSGVLYRRESAFSLPVLDINDLSFKGFPREYYKKIADRYLSFHLSRYTAEELTDILERFGEGIDFEEIDPRGKYSVGNLKNIFDRVVKCNEDFKSVIDLRNRIEFNKRSAEKQKRKDLLKKRAEHMGFAKKLYFLKEAAANGYPFKYMQSRLNEPYKAIANSIKMLGADHEWRKNAARRKGLYQNLADLLSNKANMTVATNNRNGPPKDKDHGFISNGYGSLRPMGEAYSSEAVEA